MLSDLALIIYEAANAWNLKDAVSVITNLAYLIDTACYSQCFYEGRKKSFLSWIHTYRKGNYIFSLLLYYMSYQNSHISTLSINILVKVVFSYLSHLYQCGFVEIMQSIFV